MALKQEAIRVENCWVLPDDALYVPQRSTDNKTITYSEPSKPDEKAAAGHRYLAVRVQISSDASDDGAYRFTTQQVRLLTRESGGRTGTYYLTGVSDSDLVHPKSRFKDVYCRLAKGEAVNRKSGKMDLVFEIPEDAEPWFIEFRYNARAEIKRVEDEAPPAMFTPPAQLSKNQAGGSEADAKASGGKKSGSASNRPDPKINRHRDDDPRDEARGSGGRTRRYSSDTVGSFFSDELPFELTDYTDDTIEVRSGRVLGGQGRLTAKLDEDDAPRQGSRPPVTHFDVPSDMRLLQLSIRRLHPHSTLAQAMDFARQLGNVSVKDEQGREYPAVGTWGIATVGSDRIFELVYFDEITRTGSSAPPKLDVIRRASMESDYALYYLFHIPPGRKVVRFMTPRSNGEDLTEADLVAPR